ncbi:MAG: type II secretion system protein [Bacteroidetes bacterium]|nr:MAG: type II secretion system protein [Bacteroidota bacterium]
MGRRSQRPSARGFTLIELLVVISIIALLVGILLPALGAARHTAMVTKDLTQMKQISTASAAYSVDYDEHFPVQQHPGNNNFGLSIDEVLSAYLNPSNMSIDDFWSDQYIMTDEADMSVWLSPLDVEPDLFTNGAWSQGKLQRRSYGINRATRSDSINSNNWNAQHETGISRDVLMSSPGVINETGNVGYSMRESEVRNASSTIAYAPIMYDINYCGWQNGGTVAAYEIFGTRSFSGGGWQTALHRWYGYDRNAVPGNDPKETKANLAFADGHGESVRGGDTINPDYPTSLRGDGQSLWNARK